MIAFPEPSRCGTNLAGTGNPASWWPFGIGTEVELETDRQAPSPNQAGETLTTLRENLNIGHEPASVQGLLSH